MTMLRPLALIMSLAFCSAPVMAQDFSKAQIKTEKLNDTTYMLTGAGGNIGVSVGEDAVFVIDDQYAPMAPKVRAAIKAISTKPVRFVVNTHYHGDHTGGNEAMGKANAVIVAHENVRTRMGKDQLIEIINTTFKAHPKVALPVVTFTQDMTFHLNGDEMHVFHVPKGHTDGDAIVHFRKGNLMHMGDLFFNKMYPLIDTASGGTAEGVVAGIDKALALANDSTRFIPGHGPMASKADLTAYRTMLDTISGRVRQMVKDGKSLKETIAAKPSADFDAVWGGGFIKPDLFVEQLYKNIKR